MNAPGFTIDPAELAGKKVLVTGGTKGAGEAIVRRLAAAGAEVITTARSAVAEADLPAKFIAADLTTVDGARALCSSVAAACGQLDILVHNLGGSQSPGGGFAALTDEDWLCELNLTSSLRSGWIGR